MKTFGKRGSITPASFRPDLPPAVIVEGLALLREMGLTRKQISTDSGMSQAAVSRHFNTIAKPFCLETAPGRTLGSAE